MVWGGLVVDLTEALTYVLGRMQQLAAIQAAVHADPEIQGGQAVFRGTRLPVAIALTRLDAGESFESLHDDYAYLTREKLELARQYLAIFSPAALPRSPARTGRLAFRGQRGALIIAIRGVLDARKRRFAPG
ncbi:hypothetical protein FQZ97_644090 [compost metagenome]